MYIYLYTHINTYFYKTEIFLNIVRPRENNHREKESSVQESTG